MSASNLLLLALVIVSTGKAQTTAADLRRTHEALFASFIPLEEVAKTPAEPMLLSARNGIWASASSAKAFQQLISPFTNLRVFGTACKMADYLGQDGTGDFASLNHEQREHVLFLLQSCSANEARRLAMNVRNFYVVRTYEAVQASLTGVKLKLFAASDYSAANTPTLLPSRIAYNRDRKQLVSKDGEFDYLIVGSGPAGSVLAHELRRGGKRVLLVERGAFIVPGSMETRLVEDLIDTRTSDDGAIRIRNGMAVGGGSQVNVDLCFAWLPKRMNPRRSDMTIPPTTRAYIYFGASGNRASKSVLCVSAKGNRVDRRAGFPLSSPNLLPDVPNAARLRLNSHFQFQESLLLWNQLRSKGG